MNPLLRLPTLLALGLALLAAPTPAFAQQNELDDLTEAFERLDSARVDRLKEQGEKVARKAAGKLDEDKAKAKVREAIETLREAESRTDLVRERRAEAEAIMEEAKKRLASKGTPGGAPASPGVRSLGAASPAATPVPTAGGARPEGVPSAAAAAAPRKRDVPSLEPKGAKGKAAPTVIRTGPEGVSYVDADRRIVVFVGDVVLDHPDFDIECDELHIFLKPERKKPEADVPGADPAGGAPPEDPAANALGGSGIDTAVALGRRVFIRKQGEDGKPRIGQCRKATYYSDEEMLVMQDSPQLQVGDNLFKATAPHTEMFLRKDGKHRIEGPSENVIINAAGEEGPILPSRPAAPRPPTPARPVPAPPVSN